MLWIVGKSFSEFRRYLESAHIEYGIFWDKTLPLPDDIHVPVIYLDFKHAETLPKQLMIHTDITVSAVLVAGYENYVLPAAYISTHFGVPGLSPSAAVAATDKSAMRQRFIDYAPAISPAFVTVNNWQDIEAFMREHSFPVMLKPASLMKSLLITKNTGMRELRHNYEDLTRKIEDLYETYNVGQDAKIIVEEFLQGTMHTVAAFVDAAGEPQIVPGVVDCITGQEAGFNDNFLYCRTMPSRLSDQVQEKITDTAKQALRALGLRSCPVHIEIMLTADGPKIIEVGARIGGYRPRMYEYAAGIDMYAAQLAVANGLQPGLTASTKRSTAVFELFPDDEGYFESITGEAEIQALPSLRHYKVKPDPGTKVGPASQGYRAVAVVILGSEDANQFAADRAFIQKNVRVRLRS